MATRDPAADRAHALATLDQLLTADGHLVRTGDHHLLASSTDDRIIEVWCQTRTDGRLWFTHAGGTPICPADQPETARQAVQVALTPPALVGGPVDLTSLTRSLEADLEARFPGWLITRESTGRWTATRPDWGTLYAITATELADRLTRHAPAHP